MPNWTPVHINLFCPLFKRSNYNFLEIGREIMRRYQGSAANVDFRSAEYKDSKDFQENFKRRSTSEKTSNSSSVDFRFAEYKDADDFQKRFKENRTPGSLIPQRRSKTSSFRRPDPPSASKSHFPKGIFNL